MVNKCQRYTLNVFLLACVSFFFVSSNTFARDLPDFTQLAAEAGPSVVNISTTQKVRGASYGPNPYGDLEDMPPILRHFFGQIEPPQGGGERQSLGSGFIISRDGYILTNNHVVSGADEIVVRLTDRREFKAKLIGADERTDVALVKIDSTGLTPVKIGKSDNLKVGEWVLAIGSPFGFDHTVTEGIVSGKGRNLSDDNYVPFIQTDVAINPGNSGGPLFNLDGEVVGINSQIYSRTGGYMGLSFAIPIDIAMEVSNQLKNQGHVTRGWLGVMIQEVDRDLAESFGLDKPGGALIAGLVPNGPAADAGIHQGDVVVEFNGSPIESAADLPNKVGRMPIGTKVDVVVLRNGSRKTITVAIGALPDDKKHAAAKPQVHSNATANNRLDITVQALTQEQRDQLSLPGGVMVVDVKNAELAQAGLRAGDVITVIANQDIVNVNDFDSVVKSLPANKWVSMLVNRKGSSRWVAFRVPK